MYKEGVCAADVHRSVGESVVSFCLPALCVMSWSYLIFIKIHLKTTVSIYNPVM